MTPNDRNSQLNDEELLARAIPIDESDLAEDGAPAEPASPPQEQPQPAPQPQPQMGASPPSAQHPPASPATTSTGELPVIEVEKDDDEDKAARARRHRIHALGERTRQPEKAWQRQPNVTGQGATHVKTFVAKLRLDAIEHMDQQVNDWLEQHPDYEVKFATAAVGPLVGKLTEEALFLSVWV